MTSQRSEVIVGDCRDVMAGMEAGSVDAIVTDPPYELGFMGKAWDRSGVAFDAATWAAALRVLKPGGHLLAFGGSRTFHRIAVAIEDAGFEIRDTISWLYGSGFPKSHDVSKAMDREAGAETNVVKPHPTNRCPGGEWCKCNTDGRSFSKTKHPAQTLPATDLARQWDGWGTALKPAWEPVIVARKPLVGTVARNVAEHGTGAINVDACRIGISRPPTTAKDFAAWCATEGRTDMQVANPDTRVDIGRWPANVILDEEAGAMLDEQAGDRGGGYGVRGGARRLADDYGLQATGETVGHGDTGGASRFFYCAKASRGERNAGLDGMPERDKRIYSGGIVSADHPGTADGGGARASLNHHPTVKPIALMRYLVRLVTPPGGVVCDPFTGSGTTGCAVALEGFRFVGVEMSEEYAEIARRRIAHWGRQPALPLAGD